MIDSFLSRMLWLVRGRTTTAAVMQTTVFQLITLVANLATGVLTARILAPTGRGELAAIVLIPALMGFLLNLGIPGALLYNLKRDTDNAKRLIGAALIVTSGLGLISMLIGYAIMPYALRHYSAYDIALARLFMLTAPLSLFTYICSSAFESAGDFWYGNSSRFLAPLVTLASLCAFWASGRLDVLTAVLSYALPAVPISLKMLTDVVRRYHPRIPLSAAPYKQLFSYGLRSFGVDLLKTIGQQIDQILVVAFLSPAAMGLYAAALAASRILQIFQTSVVRVLLPKIAARPIDEVVAAVGRATRITAALTIPLGAGLVVLAPYLLRIAYGGRFSEASGVLRVLAVEAVFAGSTWILAQAFLALGKPGIVSGLQGVGLALAFPLMLIFIPRFGLVGAGLALLSSTITRFVLVLFCFPWLLQTKPPRLFLTHGDIVSLQGRFRRKHESLAETSA